MEGPVARFVDVAVPLPINQLFTYSLPAPLAGVVVPGCRVVVPFGNRALTGLAVRLHSNEIADAKPVRDVLDDAPLVIPALLELGTWLAYYYLSPPGEVFRVMLPPGILSKQVNTGLKTWPVKKQLAVVALSLGGDKLPARQASVMAYLEENASSLPLVVSAVVKAGYSQAALNALAAKGVLTLSPVEISRSPWSATHVRRGLVSKHQLNEDQNGAFERIVDSVEGGKFESFLLHGVTGSGKTEVYLNCIAATLRAGRTALMLVPEIGLTPQVAMYFRKWFGDDAAILHSGLSDGERFDQWRRIRDGLARVVVGTRSAVFAPLQRLGLIIVDEEHDGSYKQEETPRYNGRDTALKRGQIEQATVVLGSATPQLETFHLAVRKQRHACLSLRSRVQQRPLPNVTVVDMRIEFQRHGRAAVISQALREAIEKRIQREEQILVLLNRRGYSPLLLCRSCGHTETCENCSISLTYHRGDNHLACHYCGYLKSVPRSCAGCGKDYIQFVGEGTEKIQELITNLFPGTSVGRLDRDTAQRRGSMVRILSDFDSGKIQILVGTQMIAKGHDFPRVTLVGVLAADQSLRQADFRAAERTFQLLTQVAGRSGRGESPGEVVIQTVFPEHYAVRYACAQDYESFYRQEVQYRYKFRYPPFTALANLLIAAKDSTQVAETAEFLHGALLRHRQAFSDTTRMHFLGPAPAARERLKSDFRYQILVKATDRRELHEVIEKALEDLRVHRGSTKSVTVDVDPLTLF